MRSALLVISLLVLVLPVGASAEQPAAAKSPDACVLTNKEFCGLWELSATRMGGGNVTIMGDRLSWENGDRAACIVIDEGEQKGRRFSALRCRKAYNDGAIKDPIFYLIHAHKLPDGLFLVKEDHADCLFAGWYRMLIANDFRVTDTGLSCGGLSTIPYFRPEP